MTHFTPENRKYDFFFLSQGSISNRTEEQVQLKFDAWWYYFGLLGPALENQIESVVIPFLKFCFSSTVSEANGTSKPTKEPQSPAKK